MTRYRTCLRALLALLVVLTVASVSEARLFRQWGRSYTYYYYPTCPAAGVSTYGSGVPTARQPAVSTAGPMAYTAAKPVIGENAGGMAPPAPQGGSYVPVQPSYTPAQPTAPAGGWSTTPRSSWDYGRFPPYNN